MFEHIYPSSRRTLFEAMMHYAEEVAEFAEAVLLYRTERNDALFNNIITEATDCVSCFMGLCSSLQVHAASEFAAMYENGCHACHTTPCSCSFEDIKKYKVKSMWRAGFEPA